MPSLVMQNRLVRKFVTFLWGNSIVVTRAKQRGFISATEPAPETQTGLQVRARSIALTDARLAVEWLNRFRGRPAYKRVLSIRQELEALGATLAKLRTGWRDAPKHRRGQSPEKIAAVSIRLLELGELQEQFRVRHNVLNAKLAAYSFQPALAYSLPAGGWAFGMVPKHGRGPRLVISDGTNDVTVDEGTVVSALCRLAASGELGKVKLCEWCGKNWRISERAIDRFCSDKCREQFHSHAPEYNVRRAAIQRRYRERQRQGALAGAAAFIGRLDRRKGGRRGKG